MNNWRCANFDWKTNLHHYLLVWPGSAGQSDLLSPINCPPTVTAWLCYLFFLHPDVCYCSTTASCQHTRCKRFFWGGGGTLSEFTVDSQLSNSHVSSWISLLFTLIHLLTSTKSCISQGCVYDAFTDWMVSACKTAVCFSSCYNQYLLLICYSVLLIELPAFCFWLSHILFFYLNQLN